MIVTQTIPRDSLWAVQTPQVFETELLSNAHRSVSDYVTDDSTMVERIGRPVKIFMGSYDNIKVTTPEDIPIAETILLTRMTTDAGGRQ